MRVDEGYGWLPNRRRRAGSDVVHLWLRGRRAVAISGPGAPRLFYDPETIRRDAPGPSATIPPELVARVSTAWDEAVGTWTRRVIEVNPAHLGCNQVKAHITGPGGSVLTPLEVTIDLAHPEARIEPISEMDPIGEATGVAG